MEPGRQFLDLYHRTSPEAADRIMSEGRMTSARPGAETWWSNRANGRAAQDYEFATSTIHARVPSEVAKPDVRFPGGERYYRVHAGDLQPEHFVEHLRGD